MEKSNLSGKKHVNWHKKKQIISNISLQSIIVIVDNTANGPGINFDNTDSREKADYWQLYHFVEIYSFMYFNYST